MKALTAACAVVVLSVMLAGCGDQSGEIDGEGHNGYDRDTCNDSKALALDMMYGAVSAAESRIRVNKVAAETAKASDQAVKQASQQLMASYSSGNRTVIDTAVAGLVKACQL